MLSIWLASKVIVRWTGAPFFVSYQQAGEDASCSCMALNDWRYRPFWYRSSAGCPLLDHASLMLEEDVVSRLYEGEMANSLVEAQRHPSEDDRRRSAS